MSECIKLAELLELAAKKLREADAVIALIPASAPPMPISVLNLSVRPRKCMNRLGICSLFGLVQRSAAELLESRDFGMTSLKEVREKLAQHGLNLRGDPNAKPPPDPQPDAGA